MTFGALVVTARELTCIELKRILSHAETTRRFHLGIQEPSQAKNTLGRFAIVGIFLVLPKVNLITLQLGPVTDPGAVAFILAQFDC